MESVITKKAGLLNQNAIVPEGALSYGLVRDGIGAHSSRTIMLDELWSLLAAVPASAKPADYRQSVMADNVLLKRTESTRKESFRRLREMYGLDPGLTVFRALRELWRIDPTGQPLLALLCACARDPLLRASAGAVFATSVGGSVAPQDISKAVDEHYPGRFNAMTLASVGRHAASSWQQSGHLKGRAVKTRSEATSTVNSTVYALLLGYLCGNRGEMLFKTYWTQLTDTPEYLMWEHAAAAGRQGWLEYRHAGNVTEIAFKHFLGGTR